MGKKWKNGNLKLTFFIIFDTFYPKIHCSANKTLERRKIIFKENLHPWFYVKTSYLQRNEIYSKKIKTPLRFNDKPLGYALETIIESLGVLNSTGSYFSESTWYISETKPKAVQILRNSSCILVKVFLKSKRSNNELI